MTIDKICVCGAGTMGIGIAQTAAQAGFSVILYDRDEKAVSIAEEKMKINLELLLTKGKISREESSDIQLRLQFTTILSDCVADLFIEAIIENMDAKVDLLNSLAGINRHDAIFATNTSSLRVTELARRSARSSRVAGLHFFNPATIMKLVEIVKTNYTDPAVIDFLELVVAKMGKVHVLCKDSPGFIVNRVARPFYIEALRLAEEGHSSFLQADRLMEASGFKLGPFKLMDLIGNDINYAVSCSVYEQLGEPERLKPSEIQMNHVSAGKLGKKTGEGYYQYN